MVRSANMPRHGVGNEVDALKEDVAKLRADLAGLAEALIQAGRQEAGTAKDKLEDEARKRLEGLRSAAGDARAFGRSALESIETQIGEKPLISVLVAFAVGIVFGKLADRR